MRRMILLSLLFILSLFQAVYAEQSCALKQKICVDGPSTKMIDGYEITKDCWQYDSVYECQSSELSSDCQRWEDQGCASISATCTEPIEGSSQCALYDVTYQCLVKKGETRKVMDCGAQTYCMDGSCVDTSYPPDTDFAKAITALETARQAATYMDQQTLELFRGVPSKCRIKFGVFDCCSAEVKSGQDNHSTFAQMASLGVFSVGSESVQYLGSKYVFDSLFASDNPGFMMNGLGAAFGGGDVSFSPGFSYFGLTVGYGSAGAGSTLLLGQSGGLYLAFDPASLAISLSIMIVMELLSCEPEEQILSVRKGKELCKYLGSYCSDKFLSVCYERKQGYCCFNSKLARIVSEAAHQQLSLSWGSAKRPNCAGISPEQMQQIDFSQIDMSSVFGDISASMKTPDFAADRALQKIQNYFEQKQ